MENIINGFLLISKRVAIFILSFSIAVVILCLMGFAKLPTNLREYSNEKVKLKILESESAGYSFEEIRKIKMREVEQANKNLEDLKANIEKTKNEIHDLNEKLK